MPTVTVIVPGNAEGAAPLRSALDRSLDAATYEVVEDLSMARGEYVLLAGAGDRLDPTALDRLLAAARDGDADAVLGPVAGHHQRMAPALRRVSRHGATLEWTALLTLLTPHLLVRRSLLEQHAIALPDPADVEAGERFALAALLHARAISTLAGDPVYHRAAPAAAPSGLAHVRALVDLVEEHTEPGVLRDGVLAHWYRSEVLPRAGGKARTPATDLADLAQLAAERFGPIHEARLPFAQRVRSRLLRAGDLDGLAALTAFEAQLRARADAYVRVGDDELELRVEVELDGGEQPLRFRRDGERVAWEPPASLRDRLPAEALVVEEGIDGSRARLRVVGQATNVALPAEEAETRLATEGIAVQIVQATIRAGALRGPATWEPRVTADVAGFRATARPRRRLGRRAVVLAVDAAGRVTDATPPPATPSLAGRVKRALRRRVTR